MREPAIIDLVQDDYGYSLTIRAATGRKTQGVWVQRIPPHASLAEMGVILHEMAENLQRAYMENRLWERL